MKKKLSRYEGLLRTYDFMGKTPVHLSRLCGLASKLEGYRAARSQWLCAKVSLDWYLWAAFLRYEAGLRKLASHLGVDSTQGTKKEWGVRLLNALEGRFERVRGMDPGGRYDWPAQRAIQLIRLQRDLSSEWGPDFLSGVRDLCRSEQPVEVEARMLVAGAAVHMETHLSRTPWHHRGELLKKTLGFECPPEAGEADPLKKGGARRCEVACEEMKRRLIQAPPELRKRLIAAHCPLAHLGFSRRNQTIYLSSDGMKTARNLSFLAENFGALLRNRNHPLIRLVRDELERGAQKWEGVKVPLPYPEMSPGEPGYIKLPYSAVATEDTMAPVYVAADGQRVLAGVMPLMALESGGTVVLGDREGYRFPGRLVPEPLHEELPMALRSARKTWVRMAGEPKWQPVGLYLHGDVKGPRFNRILSALASMGQKQVRLLFRHDTRGVGGLTVHIRQIMDKKYKKSKSLSDGVALFVDENEMFLTASEGPLFEKPFTSQASDLAGLREHLEKYRGTYKKVDAVEVFLVGKTRYLAVSRLLVSILRNSSGRTLYPKAVFVVPKEQKASE